MGRELLEFKTEGIELGSNPVFIVGEMPAKPNLGQTDLTVWHGNRSGILLRESIDGLKNIYLTNLYNVYVDGKELEKKYKLKGILKLARDVETLKPRRIICLGKLAFNTVSKMNISDEESIEVCKLDHPSYIQRFFKDTKIETVWKNELRRLIEK